MNFLLENNSLHVKFEEKFTFDQHEEFGDVLEVIQHDKPAHISFDFTKTEFIDSAGLGMLLLAKEKADVYKASLQLTNASGQVSRMFNLALFDSMFTIT